MQQLHGIDRYDRETWPAVSNSADCGFHGILGHRSSLSTCTQKKVRIGRHNREMVLSHRLYQSIRTLEIFKSAMINHVDMWTQCRECPTKSRSRLTVHFCDQLS